MADWATFAGITGVVLVLLLLLSHLTQLAFDAGVDAVSDADRAVDSDARSDRAAPPANPGSRDSRSDPNRDSSTDARGSGAPADSTSNASDGPEPDAAVTDPGDGRPESVVGRSGAPSSSRERADGLEAPRDPELRRRPPADRNASPESLTTGMVLANVAASQGLFALVLVGAAIYTGVPAAALGIEFSLPALETGLLWGTAIGVALYVGNELGAATATRFGFDHDEQLRTMLAPETARGWLVLLLVVLPVVAGFEELLFRAALIGAVSAGFGVSPWLLAAVSSVAFALGHGIQGGVGVVVTGVLGFVLAAVFVLTGSFLVVVVAHYLVNALEFVVHEGLDVEWAETLEG